MHRSVYQGQGLGRALLMEGFRRMAQYGVTCSFMGSSNAFYRKVGFKEIPVDQVPFGVSQHGGSLFRVGCPLVEELASLVHSTCQFGDPGSTVPVLTRPHALQVEKGYPVIVLKGMLEVRLKAWHSAEVTVDKGDAPLPGGHGQLAEEIPHQAASR